MAERDSAVRVALVFPAVLGTYGDGGNATVLAQRLHWRGMAADVVPVGLDDSLPAQADLYVIGGGEDSAQTLAVARLVSDGGLRRAVDRGATVFAVCAGFQILGESFLDGAGAVHAGLGLLDARTDRLEGPRAVGELLTAAELEGVGALTGYENHGGRTVLGPAARPLGRVEHGIGNGAAAVDGALQDSVVATYLHGPALARNPELADALLRRVCGDIPAIDDSEVAELRRERLSAVRRAALTRWRRQWRPPARSAPAPTGP